MEKALSSCKKYKKYMILGPLFKVVEVIFELFTPFLMKHIIDTGLSEATTNNNYIHIIIPGILLILFSIFGFCSTLVCQYFSSIASQGFSTDLRNRVYKKILSLNSYDIENFEKGNLVNNLTSDINKLEVVIRMVIRLVIRAPILVIGALICSFIINYKIALIYLGLVPLIVFFYFLILKISSKQYLKVQKYSDRMVDKANDSIKGIRVIKSFNKSNEEVNEYKDLTSSYYKENKKTTFINSLVNPLTLLLVNVAILIVLLISSLIITNGDSITLFKGDVVALISYLSQILLALLVVCNLIVAFTKGFASNSRINKLLNYETNIKDGTISEFKYKDNVPLLEFRNVDLSYNNEKNILNNISFCLNNGETIGFIGGTGAGKTTIVKLIERFIDVSNGEILFNGENIKEYKLNTLRNEISLVNQKSSLFKGSIKYNMLFANKEASDEEIEKALRLAKADFVFDYEDSINHLIEEDAKNLSGGQKQRICIARALLKKSKLLILDDSTSALDYLTDKNVRENIKNNINSSLIIITQRVSTILNANKIFVLEHGEIVGCGTHEELLKTNKVYQEIYSTQVKLR